MEDGTLTREQAIERLRSAETEIRRLGVLRLALFGSVVRSQATPASDVDVLTTEALSPYIGPHILREAEAVLRAA